MLDKTGCVASLRKYISSCKYLEIIASLYINQLRVSEKKSYDQALAKARSKNRDELFEKYTNQYQLNQAFLSTQSTQNQPATTTQPVLPHNFYFTTKYHDGLKPIQKILRDNWYLLGKSPETEHLFDAKLTLGYKRNTRLKDLLVTTQLPLTTHSPGKAGKIIRECPKKDSCTICPMIDTTGKIKSHSNKNKFFSRNKAYCLCHNIIYCIQCNTCGKQYVGQTKRVFGIRLNEHVRDLKKTVIDEKNIPVAKHLTRPDHTGKIDQVTCFILDFIKAPGNSDRARKERDEKERIWISRLGTVRPLGLNKLEPKPFI